MARRKVLGGGTMTPISFFAPGVPKPQPRARSFVLRGKGGKPILSKTGQPILRVHDPATAEAWKEAVAKAAAPYVPMPPLQGPLSVALHFTMPRPKAHYRANGTLKPGAPAWHVSRFDVDNMSKAVFDSLTVIGMWGDDGQICWAQIQKRYGDTPGCRITIFGLEEVAQPQKPAKEMELSLV